jgi:hypothetical protein
VPRRRSWIDRVNPARWLQRLAHIVAPKPTRRRKPAPERPSPPPRAPGGGGERRPDPFREVWEEEGGQGSYGRARDFFQGLPAVYDDFDEELEVWRLFVRYMVNNESGVRKNSVVDNPFWGEIGMSPQDFDWAGWRQWHKTP